MLRSAQIYPLLAVVVACTQGSSRESGSFGTYDSGNEASGTDAGSSAGDGTGDATGDGDATAETTGDGDGTADATGDGDGDSTDSGTGSSSEGGGENCGDGNVDQGEQCDDGNMDETDACAQCALAFCGDGHTQAGVEQCDDGNDESDDACLPVFCVPNTCGDGFVWNGMEECDDGNADDTDACPTSCTDAECGDGFHYEAMEECDDGNGNNNDGCDDQCIALVDPQCLQPYNEFSDMNRNVASGVNLDPDYCDNPNAGSPSPDWEGPGWYRFDGAAGDQMADTAPPELSCSTHAPGWMSGGAQPTADQGVVNRTACFAWSGNQCLWQANMQAVNCVTHYLYFLPNEPAGCNLRYCGENG